MALTQPAVSAEKMARMLGPWSTVRPLFRGLADALREVIETRQVDRGTLLPPQRHLSDALGVSRRTVSAAYELLRLQGWVDSLQGRGTWVLGPGDVELNEADRRKGRAAEVVVSTLAAQARFPIDLTIATLPAHPSVVQACRETAASLEAAVRTQSSYIPAGLRELRQRVAEHFTASGVPTEVDQVLITTGATQALSLVAHCLVRSGSPALIEEPTSPVLLNALRNAGARLIPVPTDQLGVDVVQVEELVRRTGAQAVFVTPSFANPTAAVLSPGRRQALAGIARDLRAVVVEDLVTAELPLRGGPPPPVASHAPDAPILTVGSLSKLFWCGLRVGWVRGPRGLIGRILRLKTTVDLGTSLPAQVQAAHLLPQRKTVLRDRQLQLQPRLKILEGHLREQFPDWSWVTPRGGLALWVQLPEPTAEQLVQLAQQQGLSLLPGTSFSSADGYGDHLRLPYALGEEVMAQVVEVIAAAWERTDHPAKLRQEVAI